MSTVQVPERPVFNSLDPTLEADLSPPISRLAIGVFLLGFVSLIAVVASSAVPLAILIAVAAAAVSWRLASDASVGGLRLAQVGLVLAVFSCSWSLGASSLRDSYFYSQAGTHAKLFLETLSAGKTYEAFEMTLPEAERQITGTDLEKYFQNILASQLPSPTLTAPEDGGSEPPSPKAVKDGNTKQELTEFLKSPSTLAIIGHGSDAKWKLVKGQSIQWQSSRVMIISVVMIDPAKPDQQIAVQLNRNTGAFAAAAGSPPVALWEIEKAELVKE